MAGLIANIDPKMMGKGYIIRHVGLAQPLVEPCPKKYSGIEPYQTLFILAMDIRYKFKCEDFQDQFEKTGAFIKAHIQKDHGKNPWIKSKERKLLDSNEDSFYLKFRETLVSELNSYYGKYGKELAQKMIKEVEKINFANPR